MIVGIAKVGNSTPRAGSKRSIALMSPIVPTWMMSSIGSLRERNREAANFTSARLSSIRVLRTYEYSWVPSSRVPSRSKRVLDMARASAGATSSKAMPSSSSMLPVNEAAAMPAASAASAPLAVSAMLAMSSVAWSAASSPPGPPRETTVSAPWCSVWSSPCSAWGRRRRRARRGVEPG